MVGNTRCSVTRLGLRQCAYSRPFNLFADAEVPEDHIENILDIDPASKPAKGSGGGAKLLGHQVLLTGEARRQRPVQSRQRFLQHMPVPGAGDQRRFRTAGEG